MQTSHTPARAQLGDLFTNNASSPSRRFDRRSEAHRVLASQWLARLHASAPGTVQQLADQSLARYHRHLESVRERVDASELDLLALGWTRVEDYCREFPTGMVHGSFCPRHIRMSQSSAALVVRMPSSLGWGSPVIDLLDADSETYARATGWTVNQVDRAKKIGLVLRILEAMHATPQCQRFVPLLGRAIRDIKWRRSTETTQHCPDAPAVSAAFAALTGHTWTIVKRRPNFYASTFPSEVLTFDSADKGQIEVHAKYELGRFRSGNGHRGGPSYEGVVYAELLRHLQLSVPRHLGTWEGWLFIEYMRDGIRVDEASSPVDALRSASRWVGELHRMTAERIPAAIVRHPEAYYTSWSHRTAQFTEPWHSRFPWLPVLCVDAQVWLRELEAAPQSVIHGEFTPHNVLVRDGSVFPVDWESAAAGPGEIDLASLTDGWPSDIVRACEREYERARWPHGAPASFARMLAVARLYWQLRWFGNDDFITLKKLERVPQLEALGEQIRGL